VILSKALMNPNDPLAALISDDHVALKLRVANKAALLTELARRAAATTGLSEASLLAALTARESLGSTGFGAGIAVPHARVDGLDRVFGFLARLDKPVAYDAIDGKPVDLVFLLLTPAGANSTHLALLAAISRRLRDKAVADALRGTDTPASARALLSAA
jgi:PTS system nitrogen regulatory IIA component